MKCHFAVSFKKNFFKITTHEGEAPVAESFRKTGQVSTLTHHFPGPNEKTCNKQGK